MNLPDPQSFSVQPEVARVLDEVSTCARPLIAGGAIRDWLLGKNSKDLDVEVFGCSWEKLVSILSDLGKVDLVGKSFGVAKFYCAGIEIDFALPRSEVKTADGHRGFDVIPDPQLDPQRAALRRDFTINSISFDWKSRQVVDPLNGCKDLMAKTLRHSSPAFVEDPLRVLRGFQFCSRFELEPAAATVELCKQIVPAYHELPRERVWMEWEKWATRSVRPSLGLAFLQATGWLDHFAEVAALVGCPQEPAWHPEGDVFLHTGHCLDALVQSAAYQSADRFERLTLTFAVLAHDFGKPETTEQKVKDGTTRWISPGHDQAGIPLAESFLLSIGAPHSLISRVQALVGNHMASIHINRRPSLPQVRRLARRIMPATMNQLFAVIRADQAGRPPLPADPSKGLVWLEEVATEEALLAAAPQPLVLGRHLIERGIQPGPHFKAILEQLFELQLDGVFTTIEGADPYINKLCDGHET
ncbi:MAG: HD domain-containing protein [Verrucomicrobia bacterium]|nr:HD domain-containing protein [Verrucomicrobiota bacterium]